jgi:dCMP deaminase
MKENNKYLLMMEICKLLSLQSTCSRVKVGSAIEREGRIISTGYNGTLPGDTHCDERKDIYKDHHEFALKFEAHAEMNAIVFAAKNGISIKDSNLYCLYSPCFNCAKMIIQSKIKRVIYKEEYDRENSIPILELHKIEVIKL